MARKSMNASQHTNRRMNDDVYKLRRKVMDCIYEAKKVVILPRIDVRITDCDDRHVLGTARMGDNIIWIPAETLTRSPLEIRHVVFHEICHAAFNTEHDSECPLMAPVISKTTKEQQDNALMKHAVHTPQREHSVECAK